MYVLRLDGGHFTTEPTGAAVVNCVTAEGATVLAGRLNAVLSEFRAAGDIDDSGLPRSLEQYEMEVR